MGDDIKENYFEDELAVEDLRAGGAYASSDSDSEAETESPDQLEIAAKKAELSAKKKRKANELKERVQQIKKAKAAEEGEKESNYVENGTTTIATTTRFPSANQQERIFNKKPPLDKDSGRPLCTLNEQHFLVNSSTDQERIPFPSCQFCGTVAMGMPSWRRQLSEATANVAAVDERGCIQILVLCGSALRASKIINRMSGLLRIPLAKLFAKHLKVAEQVEDLAKNSYAAAVGTPNRVLKLLELGALSCKALKIVIVDAGEDTKKFTVMTQGEVARDFYAFMAQHVRSLAEAGQCKVALVDVGVTIETEAAKGQEKKRPKGFGSGKRSGF
jgi:hypothetical protein